MDGEPDSEKMVRRQGLAADVNLPSERVYMANDYSCCNGCLKKSIAVRYLGIVTGLCGSRVGVTTNDRWGYI